MTSNAALMSQALRYQVHVSTGHPVWPNLEKLAWISKEKTAGPTL